MKIIRALILGGLLHLAVAPPTPSLITVTDTFSCNVISNTAVECFGSCPINLKADRPSSRKNQPGNWLDSGEPKTYQLNLLPSENIRALSADGTLVCVATETQVICWTIAWSTPLFGSVPYSVMSDPIVRETHPEGISPFIVVAGGDTFCYLFSSPNMLVCRRLVCDVDNKCDNFKRFAVNFDREDETVHAVSLTGTGSDLCVSTQYNLRCWHIPDPNPSVYDIPNIRDVIAFPDRKALYVNATGFLTPTDASVTPHYLENKGNVARLPFKRVTTEGLLCWFYDTLDDGPVFTCLDDSSQTSSLFFEDIAFHAKDASNWQVAIGDSHVCARGEIPQVGDTKILLCCWGSNGFFQLGTSKPSPLKSRINSFHQRQLVHGFPFVTTPLGVQNLGNELNMALTNDWMCLRDVKGGVRCLGCAATLETELSWLLPSEYVAINSDFGCSRSKRELECWNKCDDKLFYPLLGTAVMVGPESDGARWMCVITVMSAVECIQSNATVKMITILPFVADRHTLLAMTGDGKVCVAPRKNGTSVVNCWSVVSEPLVNLEITFEVQDQIEQLSGRFDSVCFLTSASGGRCVSDSFGGAEAGGFPDLGNMPSKGLVIPGASPTTKRKDCNVGVEVANQAFVGQQNAYMSSCVGITEPFDFDLFLINFYTSKWNVNLANTYVCFTGYNPATGITALVCWSDNTGVPPPWGANTTISEPFLWIMQGGLPYTTFQEQQNTTTPSPYILPTTRPPRDARFGIQCSETFTCSLDTNGQVECFGSAPVTPHGVITTTVTNTVEMLYIPKPVPLKNKKGLIDIAVGYDFGCALSNIGHAYCWRVWKRVNGSSYMTALNKNLNDVLGRGRETILTISAGGGHVCAVFASTPSQLHCAYSDTWGLEKRLHFDVKDKVKFIASTTNFTCAISRRMIGCWVRGSNKMNRFPTPNYSNITSLMADGTSAWISYSDWSVSNRFVISGADIIMEAGDVGGQKKRRLLSAKPLTIIISAPLITNRFDNIVESDNTQGETSVFGSGFPCALITDRNTNYTAVVCPKAFEQINPTTFMPDLFNDFENFVRHSDDCIFEDWMRTYTFRISEGVTHTCAIAMDMFNMSTRVICWGGNEYGQLGAGDTINRVPKYYATASITENVILPPEWPKRKSHARSTKRGKIMIGVMVGFVGLLIIVLLGAYWNEIIKRNKLKC